MKESFLVVMDIKDRLARHSWRNATTGSTVPQEKTTWELTYAEFRMDKVIVLLLACIQHIWHYGTFAIFLFTLAFAEDIPHYL